MANRASLTLPRLWMTDRDALAVAVYYRGLKPVQGGICLTQVDLRPNMGGHGGLPENLA